MFTSHTIYNWQAAQPRSCRCWKGGASGLREAMGGRGVSHCEQCAVYYTLVESSTLLSLTVEVGPTVSVDLVFWDRPTPRRGRGGLATSTTRSRLHTKRVFIGKNQPTGQWRRPRCRRRSEPRPVTASAKCARRKPGRVSCRNAIISLLQL